MHVKQKKKKYSYEYEEAGLVTMTIYNVGIYPDIQFKIQNYLTNTTRPVSHYLTITVLQFESLGQVIGRTYIISIEVAEVDVSILRTTSIR
jgi:hypothetical protein